MIVWGFKVRRKVIGEGVFFSPAAGTDAPYHLVELRRWFTIFFIPVVPLKVLGTVVECQVTKETYEPIILQNPTDAEFLAQLAGAAREAVVAVCLAAGELTAARRRAAVDALHGYVDDYDDDALDTDLARAADAPLDTRLNWLGGKLTTAGKERLLTAAASVLRADGAVDERARATVATIGAKLAMSTAHVNGVIAQAIESVGA